MSEDEGHTDEAYACGFAQGRRQGLKEAAQIYQDCPMTDFRNRAVEAMARAQFDSEWSDDWVRMEIERKSIYRINACIQLTALLAELDTAGWKLGPLKTTTDAMEAAAFDALEVNDCKHYKCATDARIAVYTAMLAAAPNPFKDSPK
jgi:hypothetical protein